jgi:hypothetical protein
MPPEKTVFVKVVASGSPAYWYSDKIGKVFEVKKADSPNDWVTVRGPGEYTYGRGYIGKEDSCIVRAPRGSRPKQDPLIRIYETTRLRFVQHGKHWWVYSTDNMCYLGRTIPSVIKRGGEVCFNAGRGTHISASLLKELAQVLPRFDTD